LRSAGEKHLWAPKGVKALFRQYDWSRDRTRFQLLLAIFHESRFAIDSEEASDEAQERYMGSTFEIDRGHGPERCDMKGWAEINRSLTLGLPADAFWQKPEHEIVEVTSADGERPWSVLCLTEAGHFDDARYGRWVDESYRSEPEMTSLAPSQKKISFRDDHGTDVLMDKSRQLVNSGYVVEIVNSLPFNPSGRKFAERAFADGLLHVRLPWTDEGLGMVVRTTGRNLVQTERIAARLEDRYGHR